MTETNKTELPISDSDITTQVNQVLDKIRPYIQADGGDLHLVSIADGIVTVSMSGACAGCSLIDQTLNTGIKAWLIDEVPGIKDVVLDNTFPL